MVKLTIFISINVTIDIDLLCILIKATIQLDPAHSILWCMHTIELKIYVMLVAMHVEAYFL